MIGGNDSELLKNLEEMNHLSHQMFYNSLSCYGSRLSDKVCIILNSFRTPSTRCCEISKLIGIVCERNCRLKRAFLGIRERTYIESTNVPLFRGKLWTLTWKQKRRKRTLTSLNRCKTTFKFVLIGKCFQSYKSYFLY